MILPRSRPETMAAARTAIRHRHPPLQRMLLRVRLLLRVQSLPHLSLQRIQPKVRLLLRVQSLPRLLLQRIQLRVRHLRPMAQCSQKAEKELLRLLRKCLLLVRKTQRLEHLRLRKVGRALHLRHLAHKKTLLLSRWQKKLWIPQSPAPRRKIRLCPRTLQMVRPKRLPLPQNMKRRSMMVHRLLQLWKRLRPKWWIPQHLQKILPA